MPRCSIGLDRPGRPAPVRGIVKLFSLDVIRPPAGAGPG
jgi:hypothetical protein